MTSCLPLLVLTSLAACGDDPTGIAAPVVFITSPTTASTFSEGSVIRLEGSGTDRQDGALDGGALVWTSSIDGQIGTGRVVDVTGASTGLHTITLTGTDSDGNVGSAAVSVEVESLPFLAGTVDDPEIGFVINSTGNAIRIFQLGDPSRNRDIALGASNTVTPTGISIRGARGVVPLGNAASVAVLDLSTQEIESYFLFPSGNATGSAFINDETVVVANQETDVVGKFSLGQSDAVIGETVAVTQFPTDVIAVSDSLVLVVSGNLDDSYLPAGNGIVTAIDPRTMTVIDTVGTGGSNPQLADLGPGGRLYVVNTGDYVSPSTLAVIDPATMTRLNVVDGFLAGSGDVHVGTDGLVYVSAFFGGTMVWSSATENFVRDSSAPICAPIAGGGCRGAFSAHTSAGGALYQAFFGSPSDGLPPQIFRYDAGTFTLTDSIDSGLGPVGIEITTFR
jgi:hypothetical protein